MKSLKMLAMFAVVLAIGLFAFDALAQTQTSSSNVWQQALDIMSRTFKNVRVLVYVLGAFGLIGLAIGGIMGAIKWKWLGMLACGLAIIAIADGIVNYALDSVNKSGSAAEISTIDLD